MIYAGIMSIIYGAQCNLLIKLLPSISPSSQAPAIELAIIIISASPRSRKWKYRASGMINIQSRSMTNRGEGAAEREKPIKLVELPWTLGAV